MELKEQFVQFAEEFKTYMAKAEEEKAASGKVSEETNTALASLKKTVGDMASQLDAHELKLNIEKFGNGLPEVKSVGEIFTESEEFKAAAAADMAPLRSKDGRLRVPVKQLFEGRKAILTSGLGTGTSGVQMPMRLPGITDLPRRELRVRDLMTIRQMTTGNSFDYVKQSARTNLASPQHEGARKAESTYTWTAASDTIKTIAHFTKVSRQALDDVPWLRGVIDSELMYGLLLKEESEIIAGDGLGQHLNGLATQATPRASTYDVSGDTNLDTIRHAKLQARLANLGSFAPDGLVMHPKDLHDTELIKTEEGAANKGVYILGDPRGGAPIKMIWGLPTVESDAIAQGKFLLGAFATAAELIDRMQAMVAIAFENEADFVENLATILAEERIGLAVRVPSAFIYGDI